MRRCSGASGTGQSAVAASVHASVRGGLPLKQSIEMGSLPVRLFVWTLDKQHIELIALVQSIAVGTLDNNTVAGSDADRKY